MDAVQSIIANPAYHDLLAILKGARNGIVYGAKVRGPHALVMAIMFSRAPWRARAAMVFKATKQHALNLAKFVTIYKTLLLVQKQLNTSGGQKERSLDTFFAGLLGGWLVFGERTAVNEQIVLYVISRIVTSFLPRATPRDPTSVKPRPIDSKVFQAVSALSWGMVMWLFSNRRDTLQGGMASSMQYLYLDSDKFTNFRNLILKNK